MRRPQWWKWLLRLDRVHSCTSDFPNPNDYLFFYNLNGAHFQADAGNAAEGGYEEWRAVVRTDSVPDGGNTLVLLGSALLALGLVGRRCYNGGFRK
jgi:hypothetical protein